MLLGEWGHSLILLIVVGDTVPLEPHGRAYHRSVDDVVEFEFGCAGTLRAVYVQRSKSHVAIDWDAVAPGPRTAKPTARTTAAIVLALDGPSCLPAK